MSIMDKLKKNSKVKETSILSDSQFFRDKDYVTTDVPMINVALSGDTDEHPTDRPLLGFGNARCRAHHAYGVGRIGHHIGR